MDNVPYKDYRLLENRREHFMDLYEFQLTYRAHPGCVYFIMPYFAKKFGWDMEQKLWFAFLNGNTQNPITSLTLMRNFPELPTKQAEFNALADWFGNNWHILEFDIDRRYQKKDFPTAVEAYSYLVRDAGSQHELLTGSFTDLWKLVYNQFYSFGRLASFSYLEYVKIMGAGAPCDTLFIRDISGSRSHRNGICKVNGRDDLDWHESNPSFDGKYSNEQLDWIEEQGAILLQESKERFAGREFFNDVGYFTLESTLCTYKSHFRKNRRYPGVYIDMHYQRIKWAETRRPNEDLSIHWQARKDCLPEYLRMEDNIDDPGEVPIKQNHFRETGQVLNLGRLFPGKYYDDGTWKVGSSSRKKFYTKF